MKYSVALLNQAFLLAGHFVLVITLDGANPENLVRNLAKGPFDECTEYLGLCNAVYF